MFFIENFSGYFPIEANRALASNCNTQTHKLIKTQMIRLKSQIKYNISFKNTKPISGKGSSFQIQEHKKASTKIKPWQRTYLYAVDVEWIDETNLAHGESMKPSEIEQRIGTLRTMNSESTTQDRTERRYPQPRDPHRSQSEVTNPQPDRRLWDRTERREWTKGGKKTGEGRN